MPRVAGYTTGTGRVVRGYIRGGLEIDVERSITVDAEPGVIAGNDPANINPRLQRLLHRRCKQAMDRIAVQMRDHARELTPRRSGEAQRAIISTVHEDPVSNTIHAEIGPDATKPEQERVLEYLEHGTPTPIRPTDHQWLRFPDYDSGNFTLHGEIRAPALRDIRSRVLGDARRNPTEMEAARINRIINKNYVFVRQVVGQRANHMFSKTAREYRPLAVAELRLAVDRAVKEFELRA